MRTELIGKPEGNTPLRRTRRRWEDNIKIYLKELGGNMWLDWLAQDQNQSRAAVNIVMTFRFHKRRGVSRLSDYHLLKKDAAPFSQ
jgi:hypothetical protein